MERWDLYDENRMKIGSTHMRGTPLENGTLHLVVNIWTINGDNQILLTKRHPTKPYGLLWECTGGSVLVGESSIEGAMRELAEEVGVRATAEELILLHTTKWKDRFIDTYITKQDITLEDIKLQQEEVVDAKFVSFEELCKLWKSGGMIPKERFRLYRNRIEQYLEEWG